MSDQRLSIDIVAETSEHADSRSLLVKHCFGEPNLARAAHRLRENTSPAACYSLVAIDRHRALQGSVRFYPLLLPDGQEVLMLGPLVINPQLRGLGIGSSLVKNSLQLLQKDYLKGVVVIGDPGYFAHLGFQVHPCLGLDPDGEIAPLALMGIEWQASFLSQQRGILRPLDHAA